MKIVLASRNQKKIRELKTLLSTLTDAEIEVLSLDDVGYTDDIVEDGTSFKENALIKAAVPARLGYIGVADDSGLVVDALNGAPGVYSARYGAPEAKTDEDRYLKLLDEMRNVPAGQRTARFVSAVCCAFPDGETITVRGTCEGTIAFAPAGSGGFGYDPVFLVGDKTYGELDAAEKDRTSHRGQALRKLQAALAEKMG
jgi:XTP/dITP diphosphohydrolase